MKITIAIGASALMLIISILLFAQQHKLAGTVDSLSLRITALEEQNGQLVKELESAGERVGRQKRASLGNSGATGGLPNETGSPAREEKTAEEIRNLKDDLRQELTSMVDETRGVAGTKRQEEREKQWREGISLSLKDFADDHSIAEGVVVQLQALMEASFNGRAELRREMEAKNLSFYEYRQESRKQRDALEEKASGLLSEKEFEAFADAFLSGGERRGFSGAGR